jgi:kynurenine formamidase
MSSKVVWLSHPLSPETPAYGGGEGMHIEPITRIAAGDTANTSRFVFPNHLGTHVDAPRHFFDSGPALTDYPPEFWIFENPLIVDVPGDDGYLIGPKDMKHSITPATDLLLLRTGYEKFRGDSRYWEHNPGLDPELGNWLRERFANVRVIGMDFISVTSRHHRDKGRAAHRALLDPNRTGSPILPVEDMSFVHVDRCLERVIISPLRFWEGDGGPCTAMGIML